MLLDRRASTKARVVPRPKQMILGTRTARARSFYDARVPLHPLTAGFAEVADVYERGRPEYAPAVVGAIVAELGIPAAGPVLDLAAGTGKLTRALLGVGLDVVAVEPQPELRELLEASVGHERVREGLAEAIPLPEESMAAVTVADAFHWFDHALALAEIGRVLRPGGGLAVLSAVPDWGGASWAHEVGTLIAGMLTAHPKICSARRQHCWPLCIVLSASHERQRPRR
jgi:SAM-dependent methyltransferase